MTDRNVSQTLFPMQSPPAGDDPAVTPVLPDDLLRGAARRLGTLALIAAGIWIAGMALVHYFVPRLPGFSSVPLLVDVLAGANIMASLLLSWYTRTSRRGPVFLLDLGLVYLIFSCMAGGIAAHSIPIPDSMPMAPILSWAGMAMLIQAAIAPSTPGKTAVAMVVAASMDPAGMWLAHARGLHHYSAGNVFLMHFPNYICAAIAIVISRVVVGLGREVTRARELGGYRLGELLGRGGMGEVYRATHRMLARPAAIKLIRREHLGANDRADLCRQRFRREAEAVASLKSAHTVALYDFGAAPDGSLYYVMELLDGVDLDDYVRRFGPMPAGRVIAILRQVCDSLLEAHTRGLVHRDIKPSNIHLCRMGLHHDVVKVLDFGLVKSLTMSNPDDPFTTQGNVTVGTPAFVAPEVAVGGAVDGRADLYAVGCLGYWLLTGRLVFEAQSPIEMIAHHLSDEPEPPSRRSETFVPPELERIIMWCLEKAPDARPGTAADLDQALAALSSDFPWTETQAVRWWRHHLPPQDSTSTTSNYVPDPASPVTARV